MSVYNLHLHYFERDKRTAAEKTGEFVVEDKAVLVGFEQCNIILSDSGVWGWGFELYYSCILTICM